MVRAGSVVNVERLQGEPGSHLNISPVLAKSDGKSLTLGTPELDGAQVVCTVVKHIRGDKVVSFKKKRRKGYTRKVGHRQELTVLKVETV
jgi:large subunit ribosomal protein L21